jgi:hypothetical protein
MTYSGIDVWISRFHNIQNWSKCIPTCVGKQMVENILQTMIMHKNITFCDGHNHVVTNVILQKMK